MKRASQLFFGALFGVLLIVGLRAVFRDPSYRLYLAVGMIAAALPLHVWRKPFALRLYKTYVQACREETSPFFLDGIRTQLGMARVYTRPWSPLFLASVGAMALWMWS